MVILATEGFDHYSTMADATTKIGNLGWTDDAGCTIVTPGRAGLGKCCSIPTTNNFGQSVFAAFHLNQATYFFGFAIKIGSGNPNAFMVTMYDPIGFGTVQCSVLFNMLAGQITLYRGQAGVGTILAVSSPASYAFTDWTFLEFAVTISTTVGSIAVRINNAPAVSIANVNTQAGTNTTFGAVALTNIVFGGSGPILIDDFRYNDTTTGPGIYPTNSWLGDLRVATLFAISNSSVTWTPLAGTNWQEISEVAFDRDTTYNSTNVPGNEDLFNFGPLAAVIDEIVSVSLVGGYREEDAGGHTLQQQLKTGGTDHAGTVYPLGTGYQMLTDIWPVNPTTGASWTLTDVNTLIAGYTAVS